MSPRPKLSEQHPNLEDAIKETAWKQIAEKGAAASVCVPSLANWASPPRLSITIFHAAMTWSLH